MLFNGKMFRVLAVILVLFMSVGVAEEERTDTSGQWKYVLEDGGAMITGYVEEPSGDLAIPSELDGYPVTAIAGMAFVFCEEVTGVVIPEGVTYIGEGAFRSCSSLTSVTLPDSLTVIARNAFTNCGKLTGLTFPEGVTYIGEYAFYKCSSLTSVTLPGSLTHIAQGAFMDCGKLTGMTLPEGLVSIGEAALSANNLVSVAIPASVTSIKANPFYGCPLESIPVSPGNAVYELIGGVLFDRHEKKLVAYPGAWEGQYAIPEGTLSIGDSAFLHCSGLTGVTIPDSVRGIGKMAFTWCTSLASVTIPDGVISIGESAFCFCSRLTNVTIPGSVRDIGGWAFWSCERLTSVTILDGVTSIGERAFLNCHSLTSVSIPYSVTEIGDNAFRDCKLLTLRVVEGSYAEQYAKEHDIPYINTGNSVQEMVDPEGHIQYYDEDDWHEDDDDNWWFDDEPDDEDWLYDVYPGMFDDGWTPFYGVLNQRMATRTGPGTKYTEEHGTLPESTEIIVYAQEDSGGTPWVLVEFVRNGKLVRAYTGMKRVDVEQANLPKTTKKPKTAVVTEDTTAYFGPDTQYYLALAIPVAAGTEVLVYGVDRDFALVEYTKEDGTWMRGWVPMPLVAFQ